MTTEAIRTRIWREEPEPDNPFATRAAFCHGYDVFGEMLGNAGWTDMLYLLFRGEAPTAEQARLLGALALALANPGPRDVSVHAAMCGGVAGSTAAASLMAALAAGAGRYGGARDVFDAMTAWAACGDDFSAWPMQLADLAGDIEVWPEREHAPGFDPHGTSTPTVVRHLLDHLASIGVPPRLTFLRDRRAEVERDVGLPLAMSGVAAAAFADLAFAPAEGEMLYLLLRLPGAAAHALEQQGYGYKRFPFYPVELEDDPKDREAT